MVNALVLESVRWALRFQDQEMTYQVGRVYKIRSRNLQYGVFDGDRGFIGIREKFESRYLFKEYLADGGDFGTVTVESDTGIDVPTDIPLVESGPTINSTNGREMVLDATVDNPNPSMKGSKGWWRYVDTGEPAASVSQGCRAHSSTNKALFNFLNNLHLGTK